MTKIRGSLANTKFPIFEECSNLTTDDFWKSIFKQFSTGRCPRNLRIDQKGNIFKYRKSNDALIMIENSSPEEIINKCMTVLPNLIGKKDDDLKPMEAPVYSSWKEIRKVAVKDFYLLLYLNGLLEKGTLNLKQAKNKYREVWSYLTLGLKTVVFENNCIVGIIDSKPHSTPPEKTYGTGYLIANFWRSRKSIN